MLCTVAQDERLAAKELELDILKALRFLESVKLKSKNLSVGVELLKRALWNMDDDPKANQCFWRELEE